MKNFRLSTISLILLVSSIIVFGIIIGLGALIKRIELTIGLLALPILLSAASDVTSIMSLVKRDGSKFQTILIIVISTVLTALMLLFTLMLRGLWKFT